MIVLPDIVADVAAITHVLHVHVLLRIAEYTFTELRLDIYPERHRWIWNWRSTAGVSVFYVITILPSNVELKG